ncbi:MAG: YcjX family protein [Alphaproteobacteria bacterium]|nr:YcjX family protein [Alphaproteobacteria bacterium]NNF23228.1 YcjX family protein [Paracoccaceae bacterium]
MILGDIADGLTRGIESATSTVTGAFRDTVIRLGVTGLSRAGKTVFITSLVANMLNRGRMPQFLPAAEGRVLAAYLQPQPDNTVARFDYESHLDALTGRAPHWPEGTRRVSELRLSLRVQPAGLLSGLQGPRTVHLDIVDYPGEWLLDLALLDKTYDAWSIETLRRAETRTFAAPFLKALAGTDANDRLDEKIAGTLSASFTAYLGAARDAGLSDHTPGRFLLPGDLEGSPALTFAPLVRPESPARSSLWREFDRRYEAYKREVVKPFFRDHFARIDRQIVLVDALGAINAGPAAVEDLRLAMRDILTAFRPGRNAFLSQLFLGRRIDRILFAATKADHLHHRQHPQLTAIMTALMEDAKTRAEFAGAETAAMAIASLRTTTEETARHGGEDLDMVRGELANGKRAAFFPGLLPSDPARLLSPARSGAESWLDADYSIMDFAPRSLDLRPGEGPPHIRLDKAAQFLFGDKL